MTLPQTLPGLLARAVQRWPDRVAWVFDETGESLTFADVDARSDALANLLTEQGDPARRPRRGHARQHRGVPARVARDHQARRRDGAGEHQLPPLRRGAPARPLAGTAGSHRRTATRSCCGSSSPRPTLEAVLELDDLTTHARTRHRGTTSPPTPRRTSSTRPAPPAHRRDASCRTQYWSTLVAGLVDGFPHITEQRRRPHRPAVPLHRPAVERRARPGVRVPARRARSLPPEHVLVEGRRVRRDLVLLPRHDAAAAPERAGPRASGTRCGRCARRPSRRSCTATSRRAGACRGSRHSA